jgi:CHASE2 domain-containing sensor protein
MRWKLPQRRSSNLLTILRAFILRPPQELRIGSRFWTGLIALAGAWVATVVLSQHGVLQRFDQADLDHYTRTATMDLAWSDRITIVAITEEDYRSIFHSTSPIEASKLLELIKLLQAYRPSPRVIGVDLLTGDWEKPLQPGVLDPQQLIVWARDGTEVTPSTNGGNLPWIEWQGVAGHAAAPAHICAAAPSSPGDEDGSVRRYFSAIRTRERGQSSWITHPTMPVVIASAYPDTMLECRAVRDESVKYIRFTGEFHRIPRVPSSAIFGDVNRALSMYVSNRIVLIGGSFQAGRDRYWTPAGYIDGVELLAHAVESELSGHTRQLSSLQSALVSLVVGLFFFGVAFALRQPLDTISSILLPIGFAFVAGWLLYGHLALFTGLTASLIGVPVSVAVQHYLEHLQLRRAYAELVETRSA